MELITREKINWFVNGDGWNAKSPRNKEGFTEVTETALIMKSMDGFTMCFEAEGSYGPIISADTIDGVKNKFNEALTLMLAVKSLMSMKGVKEKFIKDVANRSN